MMTAKNAAILYACLFAGSLVIFGTVLGVALGMKWTPKEMFGVFLLLSIPVVVCGFFFVYRLWRYCVIRNAPVLPLYTNLEDEHSRIDDNYDDRC